LTSEQHLVVLLVRLAVAASVASFLARFGPFLRAIMREERTLAQRTRLALSFGAVFGAGAAARAANAAYLAVDLSFPGALLAGLIGGYWTGLLSGVLISLPSMARGEWMTMPVLAAFGLLGGLLRDLAPDPEEIWRFSPIFDLLAGYRFFRRGADATRSGFQLFFLCAVVFAVFAYSATGAMFGPKRLMPIVPPAGLMQALGYITMVMCVAIPLKIWNSARTERKLESQNRLLVEARLAALTNQINPHFLFNTLNSIASLIRLHPDEARTVIYRLSSILRRLLRKTETFSPLREELAFIDDYLAIEMTRFGGKLRFEKDIDPATLERLVPSMLLQPIVENSIKHGLAPKVEGGSITIRSRLERGKVRILIEDDGAGMDEERLRNLFQSGVGVSNVNERLRVLFADRYRIVVDSHPGEGTRTEIELPDLERLDLAILQTTPPASPGPERATPATR
jgi:two-component system LytT family sensor kinase